MLGSQSLAWFALACIGTGKTTAIKNVPGTLLNCDKSLLEGADLDKRLGSWKTVHGTLVFHTDYSIEAGRSTCHDVVRAVSAHMQHARKPQTTTGSPSFWHDGQCRL
jgi:hypothetical protein